MCLHRGKTSESLIPNRQNYAGKIVTNFNQFGRIVSVNQADIRTDQ